MVAGMPINPPSSLLRVDGTAVFNGTADVGTNATMHVPLIDMDLVCPVIIIVKLYLIKYWRPFSNVATYYMALVCRCPTKFFYCP